MCVCVSTCACARARTRVYRISIALPVEYNKMPVFPASLSMYVCVSKGGIWNWCSCVHVHACVFLCVNARKRGARIEHRIGSSIRISNWFIFIISCLILLSLGIPETSHYLLPVIPVPVSSAQLLYGFNRWHSSVYDTTRQSHRSCFVYT